MNGKKFGTQIISGLLLLGWVLWAVQTQDPQSDRITKINTSLSRGEIGKLSKRDHEFLSQFIPWLLGAADMEKVQWSLNKPARLNELNFFSVSSESYDVTFTSEGNAVYDAALDAIFLHEDLVSDLTQIDDGSGNKYETGWSNRKFYLAYTILHELGHRSLHAKSGALFDMHALISSDPETRTRELEADEFAFAKLLEAYTMDISTGGAFVGEFTPEDTDFMTWENNFHSQEPKIRLDLDVANFIENWFTNQIKNGEFSPFHFSRTHPNFAYRMRFLSHKADPTVFRGRSQEMVYRSIDVVDRVDQIAPRLFQQVRFPFPVVATAISEQWLWGVSAAGLWASAPVLSPNHESPIYSTIQAEASDQFPPIPMSDSASVRGIASFEGRPWLAIDTKSVAYFFDGKDWVSSQLPAPEQPRIRKVYKDLWVPRTNREKSALLVASEIDLNLGLLSFHLILGDGSVVTKSVDEIAEQFQKFIGSNEEVEIGFGSFMGSRTCLSIFQRNELKLMTVRFVAILDADLNLSDVYDIRGDETIASLSEVSTLCRENSSKLVVVGRHYESPGYGVWDLSIIDGMLEKTELRTRLLHLGERIEERNYSQPSSSLFSAELVGFHDKLHIALFLDGYFVVDEDGMVEVIFHPGDGSVAISGSKVAIGPGRRPKNVYLIDTNGSQKERRNE